MPHALIVDDDLSYLLGIAELVGSEGFTTSTAPTLKDARLELEKRVPDVVLLDMMLPDGIGTALLEQLNQFPTTVVVFVTGHSSVESAVEAMRLGASNYMTKPVDVDRIKGVLASVAQTRDLKVEIGSLRGELRKLGRFGRLVGASEPMQFVYDMIAKAAPTNATVFIVGETGTGKELVAQALHELSRRRKEPFVTINCGAVSPSLIESELFGHERGSFTGADRMHRGLFEQANKGTLLLDEVTEMPMDLQVKLLRVLETQSFQRVGSSAPIKVDVRVVAATNRKPKDAVEDGKLREDLFYRLNVFPISLPPLRERDHDIELLAKHFLEQLNSEAGTSKEFSLAALQRLRMHAWTGNVRELRNIVQRAFIMTPDLIGIDAIPLGVEEIKGSSLNFQVGTSLGEVERRLILATLEHCEGDKKKAAEVLGISIKTLYNRINEYKAAEKGGRAS